MLVSINNPAVNRGRLHCLLKKEGKFGTPKLGKLGSCVMKVEFLTLELNENPFGNKKGRIELGKVTGRFAKNVYTFYNHLCVEEI